MSLIWKPSQVSLTTVLSEGLVKRRNLKMDRADGLLWEESLILSSADTYTPVASPWSQKRISHSKTLTSDLKNLFLISLFLFVLSWNKGPIIISLIVLLYWKKYFISKCTTLFWPYLAYPFRFITDLEHLSESNMLNVYPQPTLEWHFHLFTFTRGEDHTNIALKIPSKKAENGLLSLAFNMK